MNRDQYIADLESSLRDAQHRIDTLETQKSDLTRCLDSICSEIEGGNNDWAFYKAFLVTKARQIMGIRSARGPGA